VFAPLLALQRRYWLHRCAGSALASYLASPLPARTRSWRDCSFLALDIESTGLLPGRDEIVSIGWVVIEHGSVLASSAEHHLVRGSRTVGSSAGIHGLRDCDREQGEELAGVCAQLLAVLRGRVLLAHHAVLDLALLDRACRALYGAPLCCPAVDTLRIEQRRLALRQHTAQPGDLRLDACRRRYGLPEYPAHDALGDAFAVAELLLAQASHAGGARAPSLGRLLALSR